MPPEYPASYFSYFLSFFPSSLSSLYFEHNSTSMTPVPITVTVTVTVLAPIAVAVSIAVTVTITVSMMVAIAVTVFSFLAIPSTAAPGVTVAIVVFWTPAGLPAALVGRTHKISLSLRVLDLAILHTHLSLAALENKVVGSALVSLVLFLNLHRVTLLFGHRHGAGIYQEERRRSCE